MMNLDAFVSVDFRRRGWAASLCVAALVPSCGHDPLAAAGGELRAEVINAAPEDARASLRVFSRGGRRDLENAIAQGTSRFEVDTVPAGDLDLHLLTRGADDAQRRSVWMRGVYIRLNEVTEVVFDLALPGEEQPPPPPPPGCSTLSCEGSVVHSLHGANTAASPAACVATIVDEASETCCEAAECEARAAALCAPREETVLAGTPCNVIEGCDGGAPTLTAVADGTPCGSQLVCLAGACVPLPPENPEAGCADGTREGFVDLAAYPTIAGCSGGWSVGGLTIELLVPRCNRASGNDGSQREGEGCGAEDLCAPGWHVCRGKDEVSARSPSGCAEAVPPGAPNKSLFFAVAQTSLANSVCDETSGDNDVFGCGNLGHTLAADKNCGPLDRALASMQAGTCGFNEAEPPLGPWECLGGAGSHLHEGAHVTKKGCPGSSCSYDGRAIGNADKGGVLCCRDE